MNGTLTYSEFIQQAVEFSDIAKIIGDNWIIENNMSNKEYGTYLRYNQKLHLNIPSLNVDIDDEESTSADQNRNEKTLNIINIEYHIVYSISYQVPVLYFRVYRSDGSMLQLENIWKMFGDNFSSATIASSSSDKSNLYSIITQMDHPIIFEPYLCLHPCRTNELLSNTPNSKNLIITFISLIGPFVKLNLNEKYGKYFQ